MNKVNDNKLEKLVLKLLKSEGRNDIIIKPFCYERRLLFYECLKLYNKSTKLGKTTNMMHKVIQNFSISFFKENILYHLVTLEKQKSLN